MKETCKVLFWGCMGTVFAIFFGGCRSNNTFYISNYRDGLLFGPFQDFSEVKMATDLCSELSYSLDGYVVYPKKWERETCRRLHQTIVSINVQDQTLAQFVESLNEVQKDIDKLHHLKFSVRIPEFWNREEEIIFEESPGSYRFVRQKRRQPLVTLQGENISLFDVLLHLSRLTGYMVIFFIFDNKVELLLKPRGECTMSLPAS